MNRSFSITRNLSVGELATIVGGRLRLGSMPPLGGDLEPVGKIAIDSRTVEPGEVFWSLETKADRGNLAEEAFARGAAGVVISGRRVEPWAGTYSIEVDDPKWALWQLGSTMRRRFGGRVIAVVDGVGKTLTRAMIETVLKQELCGTSADDVEGNSDYVHVGLPLALTDLDDDEHDYALVELHGRGRGELEAQLGLCRPDIVVVTPNAEHPSGKRSAAWWRELSQSLAKDAIVVLCGDDAWRERPEAALRFNTLQVGRGADSDLVAEHVRYTGDELSMVLAGLPVRVPVWGRHHLPSVLAAFAVGGLMGVPTERVAAALTRFAPPEGRCSVAEREDVTVVDNSSCPTVTAAKAALVTLRDAARCGRRWAVIGEFVGDGVSEESYRQLGATAVAQGGVDGLIACGAGAAHVVQAAVEAGMPQRAAINGHDAATVAETIASLVQPGDTVLVVGGPAAAMQAVARAIGKATNVVTPKSNIAPSRPMMTTKYTNPFEVPPLVLAMREAGAALPPGSEH